MKNKRFKILPISLLTTFALITACQPQNNLSTNSDIISKENKVSKTQVKGKAEFPALSPTLSQKEREQFNIKASLSDVSTNAAVSIIYPPEHPTLANQTVATGITDNNGAFVINPAGSFAPEPDESFVLEAEKRIGGSGQDNMTVSTYITWNGLSWDSITTGEIKINSKTTALKIIAGYNTETITVADTINKIQDGNPEDINETVTAQTILDVADLVTTVLSYYFDPVQYITFEDGNYFILSPKFIPPIPVNLSTTNLSTTGFKAKWSAINGASYEISIDNNAPIPVTGTSYTVNGLTGTDHTFKVRAIKNNVPGSYSPVFNAYLMPEEPINLFADNITARTFTAHWDPVSGVDGYDVAADGRLPVFVTGTSYNFSGFNGGNHALFVSAKKHNVNSNYSYVNVSLLPPLPSYVKADAHGNNDGTDWANAYTSLQDALAASLPGGELYVAAGTYKPGTQSSDTFRIRDGVKLYGGFAGTENGPGDRTANLNDFVTILSGDINNSNAADTGDSYHVVIGGNDATFDGFTVKYGNAVGEGRDNQDVRYPFGGGMYIESKSGLIISNSTFSNNKAGHPSDGGGGAMYIRNAYVTINNVSFISNSNIGDGAGGAMYNDTATLNMSNVSFTSNIAGSAGGAMYNYFSTINMNNSAFTSNSCKTYSGGAIFNSRGLYTLNNVIFTSNFAENTNGNTNGITGGGGAIYNYGMYTNAQGINEIHEILRLTNSTFIGNYTGYMGGAIHNSYAKPTITNVVFTGNSASKGGAIYNKYSSDSVITNATFYNNTAGSGGGNLMNSTEAQGIVKNSIFSQGNIASEDGGSVRIGFSNVQNGFAGISGGNIKNLGGTAITDETDFTNAGNNSGNPQFSSIINLIGGDNTWGTTDDGLKIEYASAARNTGTNTGAPATDITGASRPKGGTTDMGAFEFSE